MRLTTGDVLQMQKLLRGHVVDDESIKSTMRRCYDDINYVACPHTATALHYHYTKRSV
jgi:threonine synthase